MIELEVQTLSERREGLLMEVGRFVVASGFTLQRQRLAQGDHGVLLTLVVRGPARGQRALEAALAAHERTISFDVSTYQPGMAKAHFAAAVKHARPLPAAPVAAASPEATTRAASAGSREPSLPIQTSKTAADAVPAQAAAEQAPAAPASVMPASVIRAAVMSAPALTLEQELDFLRPPPAETAPVTAAPVEQPFVEAVSLAADEPAIERLWPAIVRDYPRILTHLHALEHAVAEGAREASLQLAGQRLGAWLYQRQAGSAAQALPDAITSLALPVLAALVQTEQQGSQLQLRDSPLCATPGHSGCAFYQGLLDGLLTPVIQPRTLSVFPVCCRSYGADACMLALSD